MKRINRRETWLGCKSRQALPKPFFGLILTDDGLGNLQIAGEEREIVQPERTFDGLHDTPSPTITWKANYEKAGKELGVDLVGRPDLALEPDIAAKIIIRGMAEGWFTGKKLSDYINSSTMLLTTPPRAKVDYLGARRIVNGTDKAGTIAGYAVAFETALSEAGYDEAPSPTPDNPPAGAPVRPVPSSGKAVAVAGLAAVVAALAAWGEHVWGWLLHLIGL